MPRLTPAEYLAQQRSASTTPKASPRAGFDVEKYKQLKAQAVTAPTVTEKKPKSFGQTLLNIGAGALDGFTAMGRTVQDMLPRSIGTLAGGQTANEMGREKRLSMIGADPNALSTKFGEFGGEVAQFASPTGALTAPASIAMRGIAGAGVQALSKGEVDSSVGVAGAANALVPPIASKVGGALVSVLKNAARGAGGVISGQGTKVIDAIVANPQAAREGMRNAVSISDDAARVRTSVSNIAKTASNEFAKSLEELPKRLGRAPSVLTDSTKTTIRVDGKTYQLSKKGIKSTLTESLRQFDVQVNPRSKTFDFSEAPLSNSESSILREVFSVVQNWKDTTPVGFHKLARKIRNFRRPGEQSAELNAIIDTLAKNTHGYIAKRIPTADEMLKKYSKAQDIIEALDQELATAGKFIGGTAERIKTERKIGTLFTGQKDTAQELLTSKVDGGSDVIAHQAGRMVSDQVPRSLSTIGDMARAVVNMVITPKMVGEVAALLGTTAPKAEALLLKLEGMPPATRAAFVETLGDLTGQ